MLLECKSTEPERQWFLHTASRSRIDRLASSQLSLEEITGPNTRAVLLECQRVRPTRAVSIPIMQTKEREKKTTREKQKPVRSGVRSWLLLTALPRVRWKDEAVVSFHKPIALKGEKGLGNGHDDGAAPSPKRDRARIERKKKLTKARSQAVHPARWTR